MSRLLKTLEIRTSPHILSGYSVDTIMFNVVVALLPPALFAVYAFGLAALLTLVVAVGSCVAVEHWVSKRNTGRSSVGDWSIVITGLLFGLTLPPGLPLWMTALGGAICVLLGKAVFGGLGQNPFNPALVGRATLQAAFPVSMTSWVDGFSGGRFTQLPSSTLTFPFAHPVYDAVSGATPLAAWKFEKVAVQTERLVFGMTNGSAGETSALLIALGGAYLIARNMMNWRIPAAVLGGAFALSGALHMVNPAEYASPWLMLFSGGLMLGATFMASDMVGSPMTNLGCWIYGVFIGVVAIVIRTWGAMPEGVMYAILLGNAVSPQIDRMLQPRVYGTRPKESAA
ncbi:MAG: RnfABCDGE type electron transport complex subunit D [Acidobacteria bacterium]|nr:RnfABCDGE type electron transport complex subunit D [Acidobacteriota bacterium]